MEVKNILLPKSYLNWRSCWRTNWVQKEAEETLEELNLWCYFQTGPVSPKSYTPQCIQDRVFLRGTQLTMTSNDGIFESLKSDIWIQSYQDLSVWGTVSTPNQILPYATWAAQQLSSRSLHLKESEEQDCSIAKHIHFSILKYAAQPPYLWVSAGKAECWKHCVCSVYGGRIK